MNFKFSYVVSANYANLLFLALVSLLLYLLFLLTLNNPFHFLRV